MQEANIGRGRIQQAYSLMVGRDVPEQELADHFYTCTMCNFCKVVCPAGVNLTDVIQKVRSYFSEKGMIPEVHTTALSNVQEYGNPFAEPRSQRANFYKKNYAPSPDPDTLLFLGCVASYQEFRLPPAMMAILNAAGVRYQALGEHENCCGFLNYLVGTGFEETAGKTRSEIDALRPKNIVTTCAGCYRTLKDIYPKELEGWDYPVFHSIDFILKLAKEGKIELNEVNKKVAYHDPCDLGRHMKMYDEPRALLKMIPGVELVEFSANRDRALCCGGGGGLKGFQNEMSLDIAYERIKQADAVGAEIVVSGCPTCMDNLAQAARRLSKDGGSKIRVMDIIELIKRSMGV
jgi:glycolate oxidase